MILIIIYIVFDNFNQISIICKHLLASSVSCSEIFKLFNILFLNKIKLFSSK